MPRKKSRCPKCGVDMSNIELNCPKCDTELYAKLQIVGRVVAA